MKTVPCTTSIHDRCIYNVWKKIAAKLCKRFATQNYERFVHRQTDNGMDRQADFCIPPKTFHLQGYIEITTGFLS